MMIGMLAAALLAANAVVERDVVVYGSSPAALSAAVQAKRMGKSCVIVSPETRIGGLTTGGLGQTDIGNKQAFGGIALEFYRDVAKWYRDPAHWTRQKRSEYLPDGQCSGTKGEDSMWTFEPSAALAILEGWEKRDGLDIRRGERLERGAVPSAPSPTGVVKENGRIVSIRTESGNVYRGRVFIDATYEGDLMAAAGVSYTVGREDNALYGETLSGCQRLQGWHKIEKGVSAYVKEGDPSSGLLPGIMRDDGRPDGTGDRYVQAYCFRMCLTDDPANRIPFAKPGNYDEREYELLFRQLAAKPKNAFEGDLTWKLPWINSKMPNRKTDTNNRDGVSSDFIGRNWGWPEASYEERAKIFRAHLDYQRGLMWTLANHPRVPEAVRREYSKWGTCRDEFRDGPGDGWQGQLYVREARRMVGDYVMTEHNCRGTKVAPRPVAMGAYGMDSHHVRRIADAQGFVQNEGDVEVHHDEFRNRYPPYPIDYGAILPKRNECANLLVPVCVSASHIAFGSIRMEPVFFALGQVAGTAAAQAIDAGCPVQDLAYAPLGERLKKDGQIVGRDQFKVVPQTPRWQSVMMLREGDVDQLVEDAVFLGEKTLCDGISWSCTLVPEGDPAMDKAKIYVERYRKIAPLVRERSRVAQGFLIQATIGHGWTPGSRTPWQKIVDADGSSPYKFCPLGEAFRAYVRGQLETLAAAKPAYFMIDDDTRLDGRGCFCPLHLAGFSKLTGRTWTRESLVAAIDADKELEKRWHGYTDATLVDYVKFMRAAFPSDVPGSFCACCKPPERYGVNCECTRVVAGAKVRPVVRTGGAPYWSDGLFDILGMRRRIGYQCGLIGPDVDALIEDDTCPQIRLRTSATRALDFLTVLSAEGCRGAVMWWNQNRNPQDHRSAAAYLKALEEKSAAIRATAELGFAAEGVWCPAKERLQDWGESVFGRLGICYRYGAYRRGDIAALTAESSAMLDDAMLTNVLSGPVLLDGSAAIALTKRGYGELIGVKAKPWTGRSVSFEDVGDGVRVGGTSQHPTDLSDRAEGSEEVSRLFNRASGLTEATSYLAPGAVLYRNRLGGRVLSLHLPVVKPPFGLLTLHYLSEARRGFLLRELECLAGRLPGGVAYLGDESVLCEAGTAKNGERILLVDSLELDDLDNPEFRFAEVPSAVERLADNGAWKKVGLVRTPDGSSVRLLTKLVTHRPAVFRIGK